MAFHNREEELEMLEDRWEAGKAEFFIVYGRRRVGKSELLGQFLQGKRGIYFEATVGRQADHLEDISRQIADFTHDPVLGAQDLDNWKAVFAAVAKEAREHGPLVLVLDEFQYLARETPGIGSLINRFWRKEGRDLPLFLVLSGSDVPFFRKEVMGYGGATYGRRTGSLELLPFRLGQVGEFLPGWSPKDRVRAAAVFGGMPYYLDAIDPEKSLAENILDVILAPGALLRDEPFFLLSQEGQIRDERPYFSMLRAIAAGRTKNNEIAHRVTGGDSSKASNFLEVLQQMGLVEKQHPVTVENPERSRNSRYSIKDPFLRFWFRFVQPYRARLRSRELAERHLKQFILPRLDEFVSAPGFEEVCRDWLASNSDAAAVGGWWGNVREETEDGPRTVRREVDAIGVDGEHRVTLLASCKWTNGTQGDAERVKLESIATGLRTKGKRPIFYFFSREGFGEKLIASAKADPKRYRLIDFQTGELAARKA